MVQRIVTVLGMLSVFILSPHAWPSENHESKDLRRELIENEMIVAVRTPTEQSWYQADLPLSVDLDSILYPHILFSRVTKKGEKIRVARVKINRTTSVSKAIDESTGRRDIVWAAPNYRYIGDPAETISDPMFQQQYHHHAMQTEAAWSITTGSPDVVVAVLDGGVSIDHEDLRPNIWENPVETPGNGRDDDGNGFVDDHFGFDFSTDDPDPTPDPDPTVPKGKLQTDHGTHIAGLIAAVQDNGRGGSGIAPNVKVMPIKVHGYRIPITSASMAQGYAYAIDNGAKIITSSMRIDGFLEDQVYTEAVQYAYDQGALIFNSAGNDTKENPDRIRFEQILIVAATDSAPDSSDYIPKYSNFGRGIDLSAPGGPGLKENAISGILSTLMTSNYGRFSGTSLSAPAAAAVAALIWSEHPFWTRDQVAAQLIGTTDSLDQGNPDYLFKVGSGRVNAYRAVMETPRPPSIASLIELEHREFEDQPIPRSQYLRAYTQSIWDGDAIADLNNWELRHLGSDQQPNTRDDLVIRMRIARPYLIGANIVTFILPSLPAGLYQFTARAEGLRDPFGTPLAGDGASPGTDYVQTFWVK